MGATFIEPVFQHLVTLQSSNTKQKVPNIKLSKDKKGFDFVNWYKNQQFSSY